jgi:hypothetical protein
VYRDRLRRTAEGWRISGRFFDVNLEKGNIEILQPASQPA